MNGYCCMPHWDVHVLWICVVPFGFWCKLSPEPCPGWVLQSIAWRALVQHPSAECSQWMPDSSLAFFYSATYAETSTGSAEHHTHKNFCIWGCKRSRFFVSDLHIGVCGKISWDCVELITALSRATDFLTIQVRVKCSLLTSLLGTVMKAKMEHRSHFQQESWDSEKH